MTSKDKGGCEGGSKQMYKSCIDSHLQDGPGIVKCSDILALTLCASSMRVSVLGLPFIYKKLK